MRRLFYLAAFAAMLTGCFAADRTEPTLSAAPGANLHNYAPGEFIVTARPEVSAEQVRGIYADFGVKGIRDLGDGRFLLRLAHDPGLGAVKRVGEASGSISAVQRNFIYRQ